MLLLEIIISIVVKFPPPKIDTQNHYASLINNRFQTLCPLTERAKYYPFEGMGKDLIRRQNVGWILNPNTIGNAKGYLGDCYPYKKAKDTKRIVFLGDSFTGSIQVPYEKTFVNIIQSIIQNKYPKKKIEAINLGIGGYGTDQEYFTLINEACKYSPDLIIHCVFLGNDIRDNSYQLYKYTEHPAHRQHPIKKYISFNKNGELEYQGADLDYYYEMNLSNYLGGNTWSFDFNGEKYLGTFKYDSKGNKLSGSLIHERQKKHFDSIDKVRYFVGYPLGLHLKRTNKWINVKIFENDIIRGIVGEDDKLSFVGDYIAQNGRQISKENQSDLVVQYFRWICICKQLP